MCRHHQQGRWQARIGRVAGNKDLYLGTFGKILCFCNECMTKHVIDTDIQWWSSFLHCVIILQPLRKKQPKPMTLQQSSSGGWTQWQILKWNDTMLKLFPTAPFQLVAQLSAWKSHWRLSRNHLWSPTTINSHNTAAVAASVLLTSHRFLPFLMACNLIQTQISRIIIIRIIISSSISTWTTVVLLLKHLGLCLL